MKLVFPNIEEQKLKSNPNLVFNKSLKTLKKKEWKIINFYHGRRKR